MYENSNMMYFSKSLQKFPDISLAFAPFQNFPDIFQIPWKFPYLEKIFSLTRGIPVHVALPGDYRLLFDAMPVGLGDGRENKTKSTSMCITQPSFYKLRHMLCCWTYKCVQIY